MRKNGFTLIELLVVIAIIGILSSVVLASLNTAREKANVTKAVAQIREMRTATEMYINDTGQFPPSCDMGCTASTDPYITNVGNVSGWAGPYFPGGVWDLKTPWGGHFTVVYNPNIAAVHADGPILAFFLDDDAPGTDSNNNTGIIPTSAMQKLDAMIDDGNLSTGKARGNGPWGTAQGELAIGYQ